jgi:hypothetical protein
MAQVVELLPSKCKALSSNPTAATPPKKERKTNTKSVPYRYMTLTSLAAVM